MVQSVFNFQSAEVLRETFTAVFTAGKSVFVQIKKMSTRYIVMPITTFVLIGIVNCIKIYNLTISIDLFAKEYRRIRFALKIRYRYYTCSTTEPHLAIHHLYIFNVTVTFVLTDNFKPLNRSPRLHRHRRFLFISKC